MLIAPRLPRRLVLTLLVLSWCAALAAGFGKLWDYASAPGPTGEAPAIWPADSRIAASSGQPTLLMFAHPQCPCTRASLSELARIVAQCHDRLTTYVLFEKPVGTGIDWEQTGLYEAAQAIPGVWVETDCECREAKRFGAKTSGFVLLYGTDGRLLFQGGITRLRGHSGDSLGMEAIVELVTAGKSTADRACVYGCLLEKD